MTSQAHHFFASTGLNWAAGKTRQEAITKLAKWLGDNTSCLLAPNVKKSGGMYCWTCKVLAPIDASYAIQNYAPKGVEWCDSLEFNVTSRKGDVQWTDDFERVFNKEIE